MSCAVSQHQLMSGTGPLGYLVCSSDSLDPQYVLLHVLLCCGHHVLFPLAIRIFGTRYHSSSCGIIFASRNPELHGIVLRYCCLLSVCCL